MSAITSLRRAIEGVTDEAEERAIGVLRATEGAVLAFVSAIFVAVEVSVRQVVQVGFGLANTFVTESFAVADSIVTAALGVPVDEDEDDDDIFDPIDDEPDEDATIDPPASTEEVD